MGSSGITYRFVCGRFLGVIVVTIGGRAIQGASCVVLKVSQACPGYGKYLTFIGGFASGLARPFTYDYLGALRARSGYLTIGVML